MWSQKNPFLEQLTSSFEPDTTTPWPMCMCWVHLEPLPETCPACEQEMKTICACCRITKTTTKTAASPREPQPDPHLRWRTHSSQVSAASNCSSSWPMSPFLLLHLIPLFALRPQSGSFPLLVHCYLGWLVKLGKDSIPPRGDVLFLHHWHVASSSPGDQGMVWIEKQTSNVRRRRKKTELIRTGLMQTPSLSSK